MKRGEVDICSATRKDGVCSGANEGPVGHFDDRGVGRWALEWVEVTVFA